MSSYGFTIDVPFNADTWRFMAGHTVCEACKTPVALFNICEEDDRGMPILDRPTGEKRWTEMTDPPGFGTEHSPVRCRSLRGEQP